MNELLTLSGSALARKIRQGEISSVEAVEAHIERIRQVNPTLNAVVKDRFEKAQDEAKKADQIRANSDPAKLPPFHGVPCTIKECFSFTGMPNASGLVARKNIVSDHDATAVARLRKTGAIPLGVTNTSELCMWMESNNYVYGRTNNPYNPKRIVGGSSGGEGAIIASGGSPFGLGSDIGGSVRMPAFFNGVFGHKPTGGLVPNTGQHPTAVNEALRYLTTGVLTRKAEDIWPLLNVLAGPDGLDEGCQKIELGDPGKVNFADITVTMIEGNGAIPVKADMLTAMRNAANALAKRGAKVKTAKLEKLKNSRNIWSSMLSAAGGPSFSELLGEGKPIPSYRELGKWMLRISDYTLPAILLSILEKVPKLTPKASEQAIEQGKQLRQELVELIGPQGLLLYPSYPSVAPEHYKPMFPPFNWVYTAILNVMEIPVTQTPLGLNSEGLPLGVQVGAIHGNDHMTVAAALALEEDLGGWVFPATKF